MSLRVPRIPTIRLWKGEKPCNLCGKTRQCVTLGANGRLPVCLDCITTARMLLQADEAREAAALRRRNGRAA